MVSAQRSTAKSHSRLIIAGAVVVVVAIAVVVVLSMRHSPTKVEATCSPSMFAHLVDQKTGSSGKSTVTTSACSGSWGIAAFTTTFPDPGNTESGVAVFGQSHGAWRLAIGPSGGVCMAAAPGTICDGSRAQAVAIPHSELLSLIRKAGLGVDSEGDITP